ncbi:MAG TPA: hypothetical protein GX706_04890 [Candidatus Moranbacteria bacterium]|nr:hypothetical protein [Candidatus Moranbacteria bacterium]
MKLVYQLTAIILIMVLLVSCGGRATTGDETYDNGDSDEVVQPDEQQGDNSEGQQDVGSDVSGSPANAAESYGAYIEAKGEVVTTLTDALASNPGTELDSISLLGVVMVDMALLPASSFGLGQVAASTTLGFLGAEDIEYSENGNEYSVKYRGDEGEQFELQGVYDKAADALKCTSLKDGKESLISEYRKTSFGYVAQIYSINEDGSSYLYQLAISGKDGAVGISEASAAPSALTGSETIDFPKQCTEWYAIKGDAFTGVTSDGRELSFEYTPSEDGE